MLRDELLVALRDDVEIARRDDRVVLASPTHKLELTAAWRAELIEALRGNRDGERSLIDGIAGRQRVARPGVERVLAQLNDRGMLRYRHASLAPAAFDVYPHAAGFWDAQVPVDGMFRLSRFACLRRTGDCVQIEHPLANAHVRVSDATLGALVFAMARPFAPPSLAGTARDVAEILLRTAMLAPVDAQNVSPEDTDPPLASWAFHELLFHTRTRRGTTDLPFAVGARFRDNDRPPPAVWVPSSAHPPRPLPKPDLDALARRSGPFLDVLARRRSRRQVGPAVVTSAELGAFLYAAARVRGEFSQQGRTYTERPYPSGGSLYELELYLTVRPVPGQDIAPGFHHYDPQAHALTLLAPPDGRTQALLQEAFRASGEVSEPQILVTISARFERVMWKYSAFAYSLILKNVGCLLQTLYLVATDLDLAACAIGCGNSRVFASLTGRALAEESSVGELVLGKPSATDERRPPGHSGSRGDA